MSVKFENTFGYFGKLPAFNDFVKFNAGGDELLVFDKWLQEGLVSARMKLKSEWMNYYKASGQFFFFYPFTGTNKILSGILIPSWDKSGREFPFLIFFYLGKDQLINVPYYLIPVILIDILKEFKFIAADISTVTDLSVISERLNKITTSLNNLSDKNNVYQNYITNTLQSSFWNRILDGYDETEKLLFLKNFYISVMRQKDKTETTLIPFTTDNDHYQDDLTFLIHLAFTFQRNHILPAIFWTSSENKNQFLYLFFNKLLAQNYIDLINRNSNLNINK
ncbi:MAG TPA: type VI secretion system-associated protein TagF, partial [Ignavibacteriaceae bacterium]|nr:type VI secretion system-associated protein TagF [Ignavibacteriaceae bacterium]